jgi:hypothetical protein
VETHLNEITAPVAAYAVDRVAALEAQPTRTKAEKKELKILAGLANRLSKIAFTLKKDFVELSAAAHAFAQLRDAGAPMQASLDEAFRRAGLSLSERIDLAGDYTDLLAGKHLAAVQKGLAAVGAARSAAATETNPVRRAALLLRADAAMTSALRKAEKFLVADRGAEFRPPTRYRSGDTIPPSGGRVAVLSDSGSPIAGASIVIPSGTLQTSVEITLSEAAGFVGGRDLPAGLAVAITPDGLSAGGAIVNLPFALPQDADPQSVAVFSKGPPYAVNLPVTLEADGTISAEVSRLSTFQAGVAAPPAGQPGGTYHLLTWLSNTSLDVTGNDVPGTDVAGILSGVMDQSVTFRLDHTASTTTPAVNALLRVFTRNGPNHHSDSATNLFIGSVDFTWTAGDPGRFGFTLPLGAATSAAVQGVAGDDGRVVSWAGRGGNLEFLAVGVKSGNGLATADLAGRWAAVEIGTELLDPAAEPFRLRRSDALRSFTVDAQGHVAFDAAGARYEAELTYATDRPIPIHYVTENVVADSGTETWTVALNGRVTDSAGLRAGWLDRDAGILVTTLYDTANARQTMMIAVRQDATTDGAQIPGLYHLAQFEVATVAGVPNEKSSRHEVTPGAADLDVGSLTAATLSEDAATRVTYTLDGEPGMTWTMTSSTAAVPAAVSELAFSLDAAGNERQAGDLRYFAFSKDGRHVLSMTRGETTRLARGIALGVR